MPATVDDFRNYHELAGAEPIGRNIYLATLVDEARFQVEDFAPPPGTDDPVILADYEDRFMPAQLKIAAYLYSTGGYRSNTGSLGKLGSKSFDAQGRAVYEGARRTMGPFVVEEGAMAYVESIPK